MALPVLLHERVVLLFQLAYDLVHLVGLGDLLRELFVDPLHVAFQAAQGKLESGGGLHGFQQMERGVRVGRRREVVRDVRGKAGHVAAAVRQFPLDVQ